MFKVINKNRHHKAAHKYYYIRSTSGVEILLTKDQFIKARVRAIANPEDVAAGRERRNQYELATKERGIKSRWGALEYLLALISILLGFTLLLVLI